MTAAGEFVDAALQYEATWQRADTDRARIGGGLEFYGASTGAVRGTVRDLARRHPDLDHDAVTALSSELWAVAVFERRLAAIVLLQTNIRLLKGSDLTRLEGFLRDALVRELADPIATDVIVPLLAGLEPNERAKADVVLARWSTEDGWLRGAAAVARGGQATRTIESNRTRSSR
ncbi:MAG: DNA alkylation repair protein [Burkholderiaceae bacterium]|nr:DNA alkylation repair protein [Microbacteriaceae bacterium]